jgi:hypothetical protein
MMKKYNKPEIVTLALETVDVIETSGARLGAGALTAQDPDIQAANITKIEQQITTMSNNSWQW